MEWSAVVWSGFVATTLSTAFFWAFRALGLSRFSPTITLGCLVLPNPRLPMTETIGFAILFVLGSTLVPALYAALLSASGVSGLGAGALFGAIHGLLAAAALPWFGMISACVRSGALQAPGNFGIAWGHATPVGLVLGHLLYGGVTGAMLAAF